MSRHFAIALLLLGALVTDRPSVAAQQTSQESRAIFDEGFSWLTPEQADKVLERVRRAGFNVFVPVVWHGRGVAWRSQRAPKEPRWAEAKVDEKHDPLAYLIARAHRMGLEVHPWFTVALRQRDFLAEFHDEGTPKESFNIHLPAFREFIVELMLEVVRKYEVDGINLDYVRSGMSECSSRNYYCDVCVSRYCIEDYRRKTGRNLRDDMDAVITRVDPRAYQSIGAWNGAAMDAIIETFSRKARALKPNLVISVDTHATYEYVLFQGANAVKWANDGWIDVVFHMEYGPLEAFRWPLIRRAVEQLKNPDQLVLLVGNFEASRLNKENVWPREAKAVVELVRRSQSFRPNGNGAALYEYAYLTDAQIELLREGPFKGAASSSWQVTSRRRSEPAEPPPASVR
jgi:uncharacterized lipoprotein YddW (UPF0748 family)